MPSIRDTTWISNMTPVVNWLVHQQYAEQYLFFLIGRSIGRWSFRNNMCVSKQCQQWCRYSKQNLVHLRGFRVHTRTWAAVASTCESLCLQFVFLVAGRELHRLWYVVAGDMSKSCLGALSFSRRLGFHHLKTKRSFWIHAFSLASVFFYVFFVKSGGASGLHC